MLVMVLFGVVVVGSVMMLLLGMFVVGLFGMVMI